MAIHNSAEIHQQYMVHKQIKLLTNNNIIQTIKTTESPQRNHTIQDQTIRPKEKYQDNHNLQT